MNGTSSNQKELSYLVSADLYQKALWRYGFAQGLPLSDVVFILYLLWNGALSVEINCPIPTMAIDSGLSVRSIQYSIKRLNELGILYASEPKRDKHTKNWRSLPRSFQLAPIEVLAEVCKARGKLPRRNDVVKVGPRSGQQRPSP